MLFESETLGSKTITMKLAVLVLCLVAAVAASPTRGCCGGGAADGAAAADSAQAQAPGLQLQKSSAFAGGSTVGNAASVSDASSSAFQSQGRGGSVQSAVNKAESSQFTG
ncbi:uncharacterized protein LOC122364672 isoform X2 [Amphibalanus amphitrite]|uniref:uncharacterized protein LOC122364672 isoform X2 n=1 Tax=Amphibalanus amphitrite TaxID=1232801 RepID=UPI001C9067F8|nr:uncharacterized protein LOC122364672 isoform X2 [Amphibalanus amphitrite]